MNNCYNCVKSEGCYLRGFIFCRYWNEVRSEDDVCKAHSYDSYFRSFK